MGNINNMRQAYKSIYPNMDIQEFIKIAGAPDQFQENGQNGYYVWDSPVWKGIFRGGEVHRKIVIYTKNRKIISWNSDSLDRSNW